MKIAASQTVVQAAAAALAEINGRKVNEAAGKAKPGVAPLGGFWEDNNQDAFYRMILPPTGRPAGQIYGVKLDGTCLCVGKCCCIHAPKRSA